MAIFMRLFYVGLIRKGSASRVRPTRRTCTCGSCKAHFGLSLSRISAHNHRAASPILIEVTMSTRTVPDAETGDLRVATPPPKFIQFTIANYIARLTLNHAPHNVLTVPMMKEMAEAIESLNGRGDVKAILLQSSQSAFSAGISLE